MKKPSLKQTLNIVTTFQQFNAFKLTIILNIYIRIFNYQWQVLEYSQSREIFLIQNTLVTLVKQKIFK